MFFPAKILLFGEHTVLKGSQALAVPLPILGGYWRRTKNKLQSARLHELVNYLERINQKKLSLTPAYVPELSLDIEILKRDVFENHFWFDSNVPEGYGAGSSGTLIAALYENYKIKTLSTVHVGTGRYLSLHEIQNLKKQLGLMESFFHGTSSGFDPLVSYLKKPIHIHKDGEMEILEKKITSPLSIFLIDTLQPRKTETFVNLFLEKCCDNYFLEQIKNTLIPESDAAIKFFLENKSEAVFNALHQISWFQFRFFNEFIPPAFREIWLAGLSSQHFKIKLCGAGGGGFLLCFSVDEVATEKFLRDQGMVFLKV